MRAIWLAPLCISAAAQSVAAQDVSLIPPVDCALGDTCFIQQYMDHDSSEGAQDAFCGPLSYDGHRGTDFALPTLRDMETGVNVIASASGVVMGTRDGMPDQLYTTETADAVRGRECGNGVLIAHENGWQTQYCHLKEGSVAVSRGDTVTVGAVLGEVGLSGRTQFPHVHLSVRQNGLDVDPFDPDGVINCNAPDDKTLWAVDVPVQEGGVLDVGFATGLPEYDAVKAGIADMSPLAADAPAIVLFGLLFGARAGDTVSLSIDGPAGEVISEDVALERNQAQLFRAAGRRLRSVVWPAGTYTGTVRLVRDDATIDEMTVMMEISP